MKFFKKRGGYVDLSDAINKRQQRVNDLKKNIRESQEGVNSGGPATDQAESVVVRGAHP